MAQTNKESKPSKIEIAKALRHVKSIATGTQFEQIRSILGGSYKKELGSAVKGLSEEDEFALLCVLMGTCTHIAPLEQGHSIALGKAAPDALVRFQPGYSLKGISPECHGGFTCFVEVKSTAKDKLKIAGAQLSKLREFADLFGHPLVVAVRFMRFESVALWAIVEDADRSKKSITVDISRIVRGMRFVLWDEHAYMLMPGTSFDMTYSNTITGKGMHNQDYGELETLEISTHKTHHTISGTEATTAAAFFESYGLEESMVERKEQRAYVKYKANNLVVSVADLLYGLNHLPRDSKGQLVFDAGRTLSRLADGHSPGLITRSFVEHYASQYCDIGALGVVGYGSLEGNYEMWKKTGGTSET